jgi:phenylacetate-CoA ligase
LVGHVDQVTKVKGMFVHPEQVTQLAGKIAEIASDQFVVTRTGHDDHMEMRFVLKDPAAALDALAARIVEMAREITRLRGRVRFIAATEAEEPEKKIIDKRKWE